MVFFAFSKKCSLRTVFFENTKMVFSMFSKTEQFLKTGTKQVLRVCLVPVFENLY